jgi:DNA-binding NarL/FixJ family response regulator
MKHISLAVIDSYELIRCAFCQQLKQLDFDVVIVAENGDDFLNQMASATQPCICVVDIDTPDIRQYKTAKKIKQQYPHMKILAYTLYEKNYKKLAEYGIDIFLPKNYSPEKLQKCILQLIN